MKVRFIYLAAGNSRRFGSNKLLYKFDGKPLFLHLLERLEEICARRREWELLVVTQYPEIYEECIRRGLRAVMSADSCRGLSNSIRAGLMRAEEEQTEYGVFFAADQPFLTKETIEGFVETMLEKKALLGCVSWGGRRGNPVWFSRKYFQELCLLKKDEGGRRVLERHEEEIYWFEVGDGRELADIDTAEDAERGIQDAGILQTD